MRMMVVLKKGKWFKNDKEREGQKKYFKAKRSQFSVFCENQYGM